MPTNTPPGSTSASPAVPQQIGHYQVIAKIGAGGMGEVYRARDPRLNRDVAIKVLPRAFAEDPHRMARFEREAQLLASLNHPKIAAIYGLEESGATRALVMELVEGPTLAERIGRTSSSGRSRAGSASPAQAAGSATQGSGGNAAARSGSTAARRPSIPMDEALPIAEQVAEALEYAHEHGVVHRDLKPANIKITPDGDVKVLDFGLAKAMGPDEGSGDISNSPTLSLAMTEAGLIIGTAAYMAPEQAKAKQVDRRADIWAFGCVLYEMLSGRKAFEGETVSDILASVIKSEPDWSALPADTPPAIQKLVRRCLQKDLRQRLQAIGEARIAIEETLSGEGAAAEAAVSGGRAPENQHTSRLRRALPWALGAIAILLAAFAAWLLLQPKPRRDVVRFPVQQPENAEFFSEGMPSISPDGRTLAFVAQPGPNKPWVLWLRPLNSLTAQPVPGTDNLYLPFWSPDSQWIGFIANGKLEKVAASGGAPQILCDDEEISSSTWSRDGVILFTGKDGGLYRVPDTGGAPTLVAQPRMGYAFAHFLPDGRHFLVTLMPPGSQSQTFELAVGSLDSKTVKVISQASSQAVYAAPGYLFYLNQSTLMARPFDAGALRFTGPAVPVAQNVASHDRVYGYFSVSPAGVLAYTAGAAGPENAPGQMAWFSRAGAKLGMVGEPGIYGVPVLSPDGTRVAVNVGDYQKRDIWIYDLKRGAASRLTFSPADDINPTWSRDGSMIFFSSNRSSGQGGQYGIYQKAADGLGSTQPVSVSKDQAQAIDDLSPDGRYAVYDTMGGDNGSQLWGLPLFGGRKPFAFVRSNAGQSSFIAASAQFLPNGRYLAYSTNETGRQEVYVQTFPQHTGKWQISASGGSEPMWSRDGKELFYLAPGDNASDTKLMSAAVNTDSPAFQAGIPKQLFQTQLIPLWFWRNIYAPSPDGQRFLMIAPAGQTKQQPITVVVNWPALLKK